jgi:hypothetical protein
MHLTYSTSRTHDWRLTGNSKQRRRQVRELKRDLRYQSTTLFARQQGYSAVCKIKLELGEQPAHDIFRSYFR